MSLVKIKTALSLGLPNLARVFMYQLGVRTGINPVKKISSQLACGDFFSDQFEQNSSLIANKQWVGQHFYFGKPLNSVGIPSWHQSCLTQRFAPSDKPWFTIDDFNNDLGDIKGVWEASRFDWVIGFAQLAKTGDILALETLNTWLNDWSVNNPPYLGVNWKCGQEASIRVMHLALAALILQQHNNSSQALVSLLKVHLKRISPTIMYAVAQDNNHGTSEAAALYIGGSWLVLNGEPEGHKWQKQGLKWLENRADRLIENNGSFSQYSVTYHRVMLDTYSLVEVWRSKLKLPSLSEQLTTKLKAAASWLFYFTDEESGDAPNIGANDGARLIPLSGTDYRDFKPSVQLANVLFSSQSAYIKEGSYDIPLQWLELKKPTESLPKKKPADFADGGYCFLTNDKAAVYLRYPQFKFRPSQSDALHIDLWLKGNNVFRDGGTFSYNAGQAYIDYYGGVKSHNTIEFDEHDQMPRLSRFLLGNWLKSTNKEQLKVLENSQKFAISYTDYLKCTHKRSISLSPSKLTITDIASGFKNKAVLRFRLIPTQWKLIGKTLTSEYCYITFGADVEITRLELIDGKESRYYYQESTLPVIELEIHKSGTITTEVNF